MHSGSVFMAPDSFATPSATLWRYAHRTYCHCCGMPMSEAFKDMPCHSEMGGHRQTPSVVNGGGWIEVAHTFGGVATALGAGQPQMFERDAFWMYRAAGSGLWYRMGRTLVASDTVDAARMLNLTLAFIATCLATMLPYSVQGCVTLLLTGLFGHQPFNAPIRSL